MSGGDPARPCCAAIIGVAGTELQPDERGLIARRNPFGFILFARNCRTPEQLGRLVDDLRATVERAEAPVLIDQEGGRVRRLRPPAWPDHPAPRQIGRLAERDLAAGRRAAWLHARLLAADLAPLGITVDCAPVLDLAWPDATAAIGDRAFGADPEIVGILGRETMSGLLAGGVLPVIKHLPGHGRARVDSHLELPVIRATRAELAAADWRPFQVCRMAPFAMTAHVLYPALDRAAPATYSARIIAEVIRGAIGFEGALLTDDLSMGALGGSIGERCARARAAGCDLALHCNGDFAELVEVLDAAGPLEGPAERRAMGALGQLEAAGGFDAAAARTRRDALLAQVELETVDRV